VTLSSVKVGDLVEVDKRGRVFTARVRATGGEELEIRPLDARVSYFTATAREVTGVWHANAATRRRMGLA
jgi:hypothetical protein